MLLHSSVGIKVTSLTHLKCSLKSSQVKSGQVIGVCQHISSKLLGKYLCNYCIHRNSIVHFYILHIVRILYVNIFIIYSSLIIANTHQLCIFTVLQTRGLKPNRIEPVL